VTGVSVSEQVEGTESVGGLIGGSAGDVDNSSVTGSVTGLADTGPGAIGGFVGLNQEDESATATRRER